MGACIAGVKRCQLAAIAIEMKRCKKPAANAALADSAEQSKARINSC